MAVETSNLTKAARSGRDWDSWNVWKAGINEHSAIIGMQFIKEVCAAYQSELSRIKEAYEEDKRKCYNENRTRLAEIGSREKRAVDELRANSHEAMSAIDQLEQNECILYRQDLDAFLRDAEPAGGLRRMIEGMISGLVSPLARSAAETEEQAADLYEAFSRAIKEQRDAQQLLLEAQVKKANAEAERDRARESARYNEAVEKLQNRFKAAMAETDRGFREILNGVMTDREVGSYIKMIHSSIPAAAGYTCAATIPDYVYLGDVSMEVSRKADLHPEITQMLTGEVGRAFDPGTPGMLTARLPYCQKLNDGISLFLNYTASERTLYQEQLRMLLLKLFMVFPAGKLEATMIDPLELGETFAMFTKLGEEQSRIIDTKIWSQENDISEAINILRQKLETMTQAYGSDKATRLKKEPVRVLAITDFPTGFTQNALRDLQAIVRKSASYGICVFIWANREEIAKLQASQQSVFNEIKQMLHVATADGESLGLETENGEGVRLSLDGMEEAKANSGEIINTLAKGIHSAQKKIERFVDMFDGIEDPNNWFAENSVSELAIPIGIKGANTIVKMTVGRTDGSTAHHALIAGQTGAGKSTLLHTIIMSTLLNYSPDEAQLYLVDFKEGVEFKTYSKLNLPSIKVVAIDCEREFGLNILKELQKERKRRYDLFKREADREEISEYRKIRNVKLPKLLVIFDEVQELFRGAGDDSISRECENMLGELLTLGRAAGIHIILASQDFNLISSIKPTLFAHAAIRIAIKGSEDSARSVLGDGNSGARQLQDGAAGAAVYNDASGKESANVIFQVGYLEKEKRAEFLGKLSALQNSEAFARKYKDRTRILLTNAEDDIFNVFNQLIIGRKVETPDDAEAGYSLIVGEGFELNRKFRIALPARNRQNLLIIGGDEKRAASLFYFTMLSLLYGKLGDEAARKDNQLIHLIDLSVVEEYAEPDNTDFAHIESLFPQQVKRVRMRDMEELISTTYDTLVGRMDGVQPANERLFLMFFGINRAHKLIGGNMYEDGDCSEMSPLSKLTEIVKYGPRYGISCILWGENLMSAGKYLGGNAERDFAQRIVFSVDNATMEQLVMEQNGSNLRPTTAVYMNIDEDVKNTHFRPYEIPARIWVEKIAKVYRTFE